MFKVQHHCHAGTVKERFHRLAAQLEAHRALDSAVGEVEVAEFVLRLDPLHEQLHAHVLELQAAEFVAESGARGLAGNMAFR